MSNYDKVKEWIIRDLCPFKRFEDYIEEVGLGTEGRSRFKIYTGEYCYSIDVAEPKSENKPWGYLGCVVSTRKPRPGEDWTRGNDLPDGICHEDTWNAIKNAMLRYEFVKLAPKQQVMADSPVEDETKENTEAFVLEEVDEPVRASMPWD